MSTSSQEPIVGESLPRVNDACATSEKLEWMLSEHGHGSEWSHVLWVCSDDAGLVWSAIARAVLDAPVSSIRDLSPFGVGCEVLVILTLNARTARVVTAWHYGSVGDAPRLITAYPAP